MKKREITQFLKLKSTLNGRQSHNSIPEAEMSNGNRHFLTRSNQPIPRSISGQVLTDDDDEKIQNSPVAAPVPEKPFSIEEVVTKSNIGCFKINCHGMHLDTAVSER